MRTYDPQQVTLSVQGETIVGYAPGTFIKAMRAEDAYMLTIGADGSGARTKNANRSGSFEITLLASSPSNALLASIAIDDEDDGSGVGPTQVADLSGTALARAQFSWIKKHADLERAKELGEVTWTIDTNYLEIQQGGTNNL